PTLLELITVAGGLGPSFGSSAFIIRRAKLQPATQAETDQAAIKSAAQESPAKGPVAASVGAQPAVTNVSGPKPESPAAASATPNDDGDDPPKFELVKVNINGLLRGNFQENVVIQPGDMVHIPPSDVFFVTGEVHAPGSFPLKEGTTLRQAISLAQGTTFEASSVHGIIFRENINTGKREEIHVDIKQIMAGKKEDVIIQPNDVVIVPNSRMKSIGSTLIKAFGVSAARMPGAY
ncbi:MAG TPA: SLBB domain-containing protein, partial [Blastocatellia bacterium]